jgi:WD40 repeat protein
VLLLQNVPFGAVAFHPSLPNLISAQPAGELAIWDLKSGEELRHFTFGQVPLMLRYSPNGERFAVAFATSNESFGVSTYLASNGSRLISSDCSDFVAELAWHPDGRWLATADYSGAIRLVDSGTGETRILGRHNAQATHVSFSPDGTYLLSGGWDRELICWNTETMQTAFTLGLNSFRAQFKADGSEWAVITDTTVQLYAFEHPEGSREFAGDLGPRMRSAAFSSDSHWVAASGAERLGLWDLSRPDTGVLVTNGADARLFFSPQGDLFASRDDNCFRWSIIPSEAGAAPPKLNPNSLIRPQDFTSLCLVSNEICFTTKRGTRLELLAEGGEDDNPWLATKPGINGISPDARWLCIYQPYGVRLYLYRMPELEPVAILTNRAYISRVDFSPSGDELAVASLRGVDIWNTATWTRTRVLTNAVTVLYTPDGTSCWVTRDSRTSELRDARTLELRLPLPPGTVPLAVSPDGRFVAASMDGRRLQVWDLLQVKTLLNELGLGW